MFNFTCFTPGCRWQILILIMQLVITTNVLRPIIIIFFLLLALLELEVSSRWVLSSSPGNGSDTWSNN